jgi:hypothetical protein
MTGDFSSWVARNRRSRLQRGEQEEREEEDQIVVSNAMWSIGAFDEPKSSRVKWLR